MNPPNFITCTPETESIGTRTTAALNNSREADGSGGWNKAIDVANNATTTANSATSTANTASTDLLTTSDTYLGGISAVATADKVLWIAIKNLSTNRTDGVAVDLITGTAAYNLKGVNIIGPGEMIVLKPQNTTVADLHARSCTLDGTYGYVTGQGSATVTVQVAAILGNVG